MKSLARLVYPAGRGRVCHVVPCRAVESTAEPEAELLSQDNAEAEAGGGTRSQPDCREGAWPSCCPCCWLSARPAAAEAGGDNTPVCTCFNMHLREGFKPANSALVHSNSRRRSMQEALDKALFCVLCLCPMQSKQQGF